MLLFLAWVGNGEVGQVIPSLRVNKRKKKMTRYAQCSPSQADTRPSSMQTGPLLLLLLLLCQLIIAAVSCSCPRLHSPPPPPPQPPCESISRSRVGEMADSLDMSLDDLISKNKSTSQPRRGRRNPASGSGSGSASGGPAPTGRRFQARAATRAAAAPYHQFNFQHQAPPAYAYAAQAQAMAMVAAPSGVETGTKLYISNLDYNVSNEDIKELFAEVGDLKRYSINYDKSGRSKGTAEVIFSRKSDALAALKRYNNVQLDGKDMKIEVIGTNIEPPAPAIFTLNTPTIGNFSFPSYSGPGRGGDGGRGWPRGRGGFGGRGAVGRGRGRGDVGRGRGRGGRGSQPVSATDLDADLDKYHSEAMQIS